MEKTINLTPTWEGVLPALIQLLGTGRFEAIKTANEELARMAKLADAYVKLVKTNS